MIIIQSVQAETIFINNFWNTLGYGENSVTTDWSEAGRIDFSLLGFTNALYLKNDFSNLYIGVLVLGEINETMIWRVNFDVDADSDWAEDCKEMELIPNGDSFTFTYLDKYYNKGYLDPYEDSISNFIASFREFSEVGNNYTIMELTIPLTSNDYRRDLQVDDPESTIIGISIDVFMVTSVLNDTWRGGSYPNYADSSNYGQILFAGPQDRKIPNFEDEIPPTTTTTTPPAETTQTQEQWERAAASSFEGWVGFIAIVFLTFVFRKRQRRTS